MANGLLITGTDTECGKTEVTLGLMHALQGRGLRVLGMKPVASGALPTPRGLRNEDALRIQAQGSTPLPYRQVNPYAFEPPVAPHLAAAEAGVEIAFDPIREGVRGLARQADLVLVEGVGGWRVPLGPDGDLCDLARTLELPVILVVGMRLGCINHALLSVESIVASGLPLAGWVANRVDPGMRVAEGNLRTLRQGIPAPLLGEVPRLARPTPEGVATALDPTPLGALLPIGD
ncbi:MAG: dethiobiotin synthase [gamma proteobacterium symbiont of Phacoides pectinatus]